MPELLRYRGRSIDTADVEFLRAIVAEHSDASRRALSVAVCRAWDWRQANGVLRDGVCRSLLVALERAGHIVLPAPHQVSPPRPRRRPSAVEVDSSPLEARLRSAAFLGSTTPCATDWAVLPFVRQFAAVAPAWFEALDLPSVRSWLNGWLAGPLFAACMHKVPAEGAHRFPSL